MVGFEILLNGKPIYTIGVGDFGILSADVMHHRIQTNAGPIDEEIAIWGHGLNSTEPDEKRGVVWPRVNATIGDVITIRVVETDNYDPGEPLVDPESPPIDR